MPPSIFLTPGREIPAWTADSCLLNLFFQLREQVQSFERSQVI
jgi:hypothetical protein